MPGLPEGTHKAVHTGTDCCITFQTIDLKIDPPEDQTA